MLGGALGDSLEGAKNFKVSSVSLWAPEKGLKVSTGKCIYEIDTKGCWVCMRKSTFGPLMATNVI